MNILRTNKSGVLLLILFLIGFLPIIGINDFANIDNSIHATTMELSPTMEFELGLNEVIQVIKIIESDDLNSTPPVDPLRDDGGPGIPD